jgi:hypothetical protein
MRKRNAFIIHGPYWRFLSSPVTGSFLANSGGARWKLSV